MAKISQNRPKNDLFDHFFDEKHEILARKLKMRKSAQVSVVQLWFGDQLDMVSELRRREHQGAIEIKNFKNHNLTRVPLVHFTKNGHFETSESTKTRYFSVRAEKSSIL